MDTKSDTPALSWQEIEKELTTANRRRQILANVIGVCTCFSYFAFFDEARPQLADPVFRYSIAAGISIGLFFLAAFLSKKWTEKIISFIQLKIEKAPIPEILDQEAKKRLLHLPMSAAAISLLNWCIASISVPFCFSHQAFSIFIATEELKFFFWIVFGIFISGLVTSAIVFFLTELMCRPVWEKFFPEGEFIQAEGIFRINLWSRILIIFLMVSVFPLADMAIVSYSKAQMMLTQDPKIVLKSLSFLIIFLLTVEISLVILLSIFMSRSIVEPILNLKNQMQKVGKGDFSARAKVIDNNELGILSQHFNQMTKGLKERYELLRSLAIAKQIQQSLLPRRMPRIDGLDIAGKSLYCDQTGGDYFDFIDSVGNNQFEKIIALGDVSGHGLPSALLMTSARAFLRQRIALSGPLDKIADDVNKQFCKDVEDSGRFMTLFLLAYNHTHETIDWIRAGHDPAMLYDPTHDNFKELKGRGIPLGVDELFTYEKNSMKCVRKGQIIFIGTDGIWESCNEQGKMFGKEKVKQIIRSHKNESSKKIMAALFKSLESFMGNQPPADDITLVVLKRV